MKFRKKLARSSKAPARCGRPRLDSSSSLCLKSLLVCRYFLAFGASLARARCIARFGLGECAGLA